MNDSAIPSFRLLRKSDQRSASITQHGDDWMDDEMQRQPVTVHLHRHRIDEKRHIVVADLDDGVCGLPPVFAERGIECAHFRLPRLTLAGESSIATARRCRDRPAGVRSRSSASTLPVITLNEFLDFLAPLGCDFGPHEGSDFGKSLCAPIVLE
jgi:hypothetical protein